LQNDKGQQYIKLHGCSISDTIYNRKYSQLYFLSCHTIALLFLMGLSDTYLHAQMQYLVPQYKHIY